MMKLLLALIILIPQFAYMAFGAEEEHSSCGPVDEIAHGLAKNYHEYPAFVGAGGQEGRVAITVFLNPDTGSFTVLGIKESGTACEILDGQYWRVLAPHIHQDSDDGDSL